MERERGKKHVTPRDVEGTISGSERTTKLGWLEVDQGSVPSFPVPSMEDKKTSQRLGGYQNESIEEK